MNKLIILFLLILFFCGCLHTKPKDESKKAITEIERLQKVNDRIEHDLTYVKEKILLLSEVRKISFDTLNLILRDYRVGTDTVLSSDKKSEYSYQSVIAKIGNKYKMSKAKIASLIFSFKYEMLTKEDIGESAVQDFKDNYEEEAPEPVDPY